MEEETMCVQEQEIHGASVYFLYLAMNLKLL